MSEFDWFSPSTWLSGGSGLGVPPAAEAGPEINYNNFGDAYVAERPGAPIIGWDDVNQHPGEAYTQEDWNDLGFRAPAGMYSTNPLAYPQAPQVGVDDGLTLENPYQVRTDNGLTLAPSGAGVSDPTSTTAQQNTPTATGLPGTAGALGDPASKPWWNPSSWFGGGPKQTDQERRAALAAEATRLGLTGTDRAHFITGGGGSGAGGSGGGQQKEPSSLSELGVPLSVSILGLGALMKIAEDRRKGDKEKAAADAKAAEVRAAIAGMGSNPFSSRNPFEQGGYDPYGGGLGGPPIMTSQTPGWETPGGYQRSSGPIGGGAYGRWNDPGSLRMGLLSNAPGTPIETSVLQRDLGAYMDPYARFALEPALQQMQQQQNLKRNKVAAASVSLGAFGGIRQRQAAAAQDWVDQLAQGDLLNMGMGRAYESGLGAAQKDITSSLDWNKTASSKSLAERSLGQDWIKSQADYDLNKARIMAGVQPGVAPTSNYGQLLMSGGLAGLSRAV